MSHSSVCRISLILSMLELVPFLHIPLPGVPDSRAFQLPFCFQSNLLFSLGQRNGLCQFVPFFFVTYQCDLVVIIDKFMYYTIFKLNFSLFPLLLTILTPYPIMVDRLFQFYVPTLSSNVYLSVVCSCLLVTTM